MDPLSQLKDITVPSAVDWWPLAWGWWVLIGIVALLTLLVSFYAIRVYRFNYPRRQAIKAIKQWSAHGVEHSFSHGSQIIKQVFKTYFPNQQVTYLYGDDFHHLMMAQLTSKQRNQVSQPIQDYLTQLYLPESKQVEVEGVAEAIAKWLKYADLKTLHSQPNQNGEWQYV